CAPSSSSSRARLAERPRERVRDVADLLLREVGPRGQVEAAGADLLSGGHALGGGTVKGERVQRWEHGPGLDPGLPQRRADRVAAPTGHEDRVHPVAVLYVVDGWPVGLDWERREELVVAPRQGPLPRDDLLDPLQLRHADGGADV